MRSFWYVVLGFNAVALWACSSSSSSSSNSVAIDANALCNEIVNQCNVTTDGTLEQCSAALSENRVTQACANLVKTATCDDLSNANSTLNTTCFPSCSDPGAYHCNGDGTITECAAEADGGTGRSRTLDCNAVCANEQGTTYTGACGTSYQTHASPHDICWCN